MAHEQENDIKVLPPDTSYCIWCGAKLSEDGECKKCGRKQTRVCFCGQELLPGENRCPSCLAEWTGVVKVRRRHRRSSSDRNEMLFFIALGVFIALVLGAMTYSYIGKLAVASAPEGQLPDSVSERFDLAINTLNNKFGLMGEAVSGRTSAALLFIVFALLGALVAFFAYVWRHGWPTLGNRSSEEADVRRKRRS